MTCSNSMAQPGSGDLNLDLLGLLGTGLLLFLLGTGRVRLGVVADDSERWTVSQADEHARLGDDFLLPLVGDLAEFLD